MPIDLHLKKMAARANLRVHTLMSTHPIRSLLPRNMSKTALPHPLSFVNLLVNTSRKVNGPITDVVKTALENTEPFDYSSDLARPGEWKKPDEEASEDNDRVANLDELYLECHEDLRVVSVVTDATVPPTSRHQAVSGYGIYTGGVEPDDLAATAEAEELLPIPRPLEGPPRSEDMLYVNFCWYFVGELMVAVLEREVVEIPRNEIFHHESNGKANLAQCLRLPPTSRAIFSPPEESQASSSSSSASVLGSDVRGRYHSTVPSQARSRSSSVIREESRLPSTARPISRSSSPASSAGSPSHGNQEMEDVLETLAQPLVLNMLEDSSNMS
ncbi:hypothetical protein L218DRAFT_1003990 [Marasmius fiardii PR-910]|nr:hypothetical protein L218DRAFT_1003990 [Marasmius fiardii PR-910]